MARKKAATIPFDDLGFSEDKDALSVEGLRQNNLKNLYFSIPHDKVTVIVGPSGSGKSSLAFDTLFAEGRWRFMESLSTYTRLFLERMDRPDLDAIRNIRPAIAVEQKNPVRTSRSTVGTATEIYDYLRLLFGRIGKVRCPECGEDVAATNPALAADSLVTRRSGAGVLIGFDMEVSGRTASELSDLLMKKGFIRVIAGDGLFDLTEETLPDALPQTIGVVADRVIVKESARQRITESMEAAFSEGKGKAWARAGEAVERFSSSPTCVNCGRRVERPTPLTLSFNHPVGACQVCKGFGNVLKYDEDKIVPDKNLTLREGAIEPWTKPAYTWWQEELEKHAEEYGIDLDKPFSKLTKKERQLVFEGAGEFEGIEQFFDYLESKKYKLHIKVFSSRYKGQVACGGCNGTRLKKDSLAVTVGGLNIAEVSALTIKEARSFFDELKLTPFETEIAKEVLKQITVKLDFLNQTGLGYITLDRLTKTLSGGEAQRATIATQLASTLCGVLYILDEPSIGLHPADVDMLINQIRRLASAGNTVVIVEHDPRMIETADNILELGPGSGARGGEIVYSGPTADFLKNARTLTSDYLSGRERVHVPRWRRHGSGRFLTVRGARGNNLKNVDLKVPARTMTCVTGVSGSGKSTLVVDTLYNIVGAHFGEKAERPLPYARVEGLDSVNGVNLIDQSPVGRTPRSNPLTYIGGFDEIRQLYASLSPARASGLSAGHFSFNVPGGRCESCKGEGVEKLEMYFLPDVYVKCAECGGRRYRPRVLDIRYRGKNIYECLEMTFDEASAHFPNEPELQKRFAVIKDVGLGYLKMGQAATTLSGGEAQRLKVARELVGETKGDILYILDEPTTGLHMDDVKRLLSVLGRLVDAGNTVLIIEHNLDCIKTADHVIDLGPGGGADGGRIIAEGTPEEVASSRESLTGAYLKESLR